MANVTFEGATPHEDQAIRQIVALAMDAPARANSGHTGTAMALAPLGVTLFSRILRHDPLQPEWLDRDRFILSAGHASILQYGLAHTFGYNLAVEDLEAFRQPHSRTPGHPEAGVTPTVEVTTGPLGQGLANGVGMAIAERQLRSQHGSDLVDHRVWVIAGDGCLEEGISHEAASLAGSLGLDRLTVFYDDNHITIDGGTELALRDDTAGRFRAYGWHVIDLGEQATSVTAIEAACCDAIAEVKRPTLVILRSHIGFPSPTMVDRKEAHGTIFSTAAIAETKEILGVEQTPFTLDSELPRHFVAALQERELVKQWEARMSAAGPLGEALRTQFVHHGVDPHAPEAPRYEPGTKVATRKALQRALDAVASNASGIIAGSADLTDNTGVVLPGTRQHTHPTPDGRQIYYGIREFAMGAIMVGMSLHGGVRPLGSTFFVFSDYVRPAIRLAALSHASTLFVFTHDSIGVGEDGPTHQPVEQLMSLRAMPHLHVVRPSDGNETLDLVHELLTDADMAPTALILSRQDLPVLEGEAAAASHENAHRGAYVARETVGARCTLIGTGSEVSVCLAAADQLAELGIAVRVVAMPCWTCFEDQSVEYRTSVLPRSHPTVAVEAGATLGWYRYADEAIGIDTFGLSAPGGYVFEYFNITADAVAAHIARKLEDEQ